MQHLHTSDHDMNNKTHQVHFLSGEKRFLSPTPSSNRVRVEARLIDEGTGNAKPWAWRGICALDCRRWAGNDKQIEIEILVGKTAEGRSLLRVYELISH